MGFVSSGLTATSLNQTTRKPHKAQTGGSKSDRDKKMSKCKEPTKKQLDELEKLRKNYYDAKAAGSADAEAAGEVYHDYATDLMIDLSGRLDTLPDEPTDGGTSGGGGGDVVVVVPGQPTKPEEGSYFIKEGGWGADTNPDNWDVNQMRDKPDRFKVIDRNSKNVATDFLSAAIAANYIAWYREEAKHKPDDGGGGGGTGGGNAGVDKFGIAKIYPDGPGGKFLTDFKIEFKTRHYRSGKPDEPTMEYTNAAGSPNNGKQAVTNQEVTFYQQITKFKKKDDTISVKILGGAHSSSGGGKTGTCYDNQINVFGGNGNTLEVERPHPSMHPCHQKTAFKIGETLVGKWIGVKMICYLINGGKDRHLEMQIDFPVADIAKPANAWRKYWSVDDTGQLPKGHIIDPIGSLTTVRIDGVEKNGVEFKYASVREISAKA